MFKIIALIKLYGDDNGRKAPFFSGYRPLVDCQDGMKKSGSFKLIDRSEFFPGDEGLVEVSFLNKDFLGDDFGVGVKFTFGEGRQPLGDGEVFAVFE